MARPSPRTPPSSSHPTASDAAAELGLERLVFFSDAVMAIAATLLAVDLRVPEIAHEAALAELPGQLTALTPKIVSFVLSFVIIGVYWLAHHQNFGYIRRYDRRLLLLNLLFLLFIALLPFVTGILGQYSYLSLANALYAANAAAIGLAMSTMWWYAFRGHRLVDASLAPKLVRAVTLRSFVAPVMFGGSIPLAFVHPLAAQATWWLVFGLALAARRIFMR